MFNLEILGSNATAPTREGAASSYLVSGETGLILVDAGPGSLLAYARSHELDQLRAIVLTHLHADHSLDIMAWAYRWTFPRLRPPIPLYVPRGEQTKLAAFDDLYGIPTLETMRRPITGTFDVRQLLLDGEETHLIDGIKLTSYAARHAVPSAALRFEGKKTIAFSSDTGDCPGVRAAARDADLFVCEATYPRGHEKEIREHGHLTPALAAGIAGDEGVGQLILTHFTSPDDWADGLATATAIHGPRVAIAKPGARF